MSVQIISLRTNSITSFSHDNTGDSSKRPLKIPRIKLAATAFLRHGYRTASNHAAELRHQNSLNSACTLPDLVMKKIFMECAYLGVHYQSDEGDTWSWVAISYVCSSWRRVALQTPDLWRFVDFSHPRWYMLTWARAKMSCPHVIATVTDNNIRQLRRTLQLAHRIQDIHLVSPFDKVHPLLESLTHPNPSVESVILDVRPSQIPLVDNYAPPSFPTSYSGPPLTKLKYLELHHAPFYLLTTRCVNLTHFHLHDLPYTERPTLVYFFSMLKNLTHLRSLTLDRSFPINIGVETGEPVGRVELPKLEYISLVGNMLETGNMLKCLGIPPSAHLVIRITTLTNLASTLSKFGESLASYAWTHHHVAPLEILVLTGHEVGDRYTTDAAFLPNPEYRQSLRIRAFSAGSEEGGAVIDLTINPEECASNDDEMITALSAIWEALPLGRIHTLALQNLDIVTQSSWTAFLQPLASLRVLHIAGPHAPSGLVWALLLNARSHRKRFKGRQAHEDLLVKRLEDVYLHNVNCSSGGYMVASHVPVNSHRDLDDSPFLDVLIASLRQRCRFSLSLRSLCIAQCTFYRRKTVDDARAFISNLICDFRNVMKEEMYDESFPARYPPQWRVEHAVEQVRHYHRLRALTELDSNS